jgi:hypothetical protein
MVCLNSKVFMFARETVRTFYKGVRSSSKGFVTVERLCGTLISLRSNSWATFSGSDILGSLSLRKSNKRLTIEWHRIFGRKS